MIAAALVCDADERVRLRSALDGIVRVRFCTRVAELRSLVRRARVELLVIEPNDAAGISIAEYVAELRAQRLSMQIVVYCKPTVEHIQEIVKLAKAGADHVLLQGVDHISEVVSRLLARETIPSVQIAIIDDLRPRLSAITFPIVSFCVSNARHRLTVDRVATSLGTSPRTLINRLTAGGLPGPGAVVMWSRVLLAARLLSDTDEPIQTVALEAGFRSDTAFRVACKRYTGMRPREIRRGHRYHDVLGMFLDMRAARLKASA